MMQAAPQLGDIHDMPGLRLTVPARGCSKPLDLIKLKHKQLAFGCSHQVMLAMKKLL
jgi:hypothetical protein